jgi:hypothetical protein
MRANLAAERDAKMQGELADRLKMDLKMPGTGNYVDYAASLAGRLSAAEKEQLIKGIEATFAADPPQEREEGEEEEEEDD